MGRRELVERQPFVFRLGRLRGLGRRRLNLLELLSALFQPLLAARVWQHEFDHLAGKLYVDHIRDMTQRVVEDEWLAHQQEPD